jgi:RNA polymerase sigma factor (sigma-70 family)
MRGMDSEARGKPSATGTDADMISLSGRDPAAFASVFDRHFESVHAFARRRVGADLADEIASETFTRAFDRRARYDLTVLDARPWLLGIATNLLRRHWRSERRRLAAYARHGVPADSHAAFAEGGAKLAGALQKLGKHERDVLFLYALAELSYQEIALALGVPIGTVRSRLARARARLRAELIRESLPPAVEESANA